jgi:hypothetical protein
MVVLQRVFLFCVMAESRVVVDPVVLSLRKGRGGRDGGAEVEEGAMHPDIRMSPYTYLACRSGS